MSRRRVAIAIAVTLVVVLVGAGWWRRARLEDERDAARRARRADLATLARVRTELRDTVVRAASIETDNASLRANATELTAVAQGLADQIRGVEKERDDAALAAWVAGGQVGALRTCLDGLNRALNQVSVGDPAAVRTLGTVQSECRAVGA